MRFSAPLLIAFLALAACRTPQPSGSPLETPADSVVVSDPLYDPDQYDPQGVEAARATLLRDNDVVEGQVLVQNDTVRVSVVMNPLEEEVIRQKAEQFVVLAARELEGGVQASSPGTTLGPTRFPYLVVIQDPAGGPLYSGFKAPGSSSLQPAPAFSVTGPPAGS